MHVIGTAGHVDHGKSTLITALTGMNPDRLAEEQERGLTIDLGFAWFTLPSGREVGVVDVPGHERFIRNMLAGVGGIDASLFVVAADEGWMPQSAEHLAILDFLDVRAGVVALSKTDLVEAAMADLVAAEVSERLRGTSLQDSPIVPVSAVTGGGLDALRTALDDVLAQVSEKADRGRPRLFVDRSFTITGAGTVVTGTLTGGGLRAGDDVEILPSRHRARIRSLQTHGKPVDVAVPGSRVALNLVGLERAEVVRGDAVVSPDEWHPTDAFAARIRAARGLDHPIVERGAYELFAGSAEVASRLKFLEDPPPHPGRIPALVAGADLLAQVFCMRPLPLEPGDRFVIRDIGRWETVAGGVVLDHVPGRIRRNDPDVLERLRARERAAREDVVRQLVAERGAVERADLRWLAGAGQDEIPAAVERAVAGGTVVPRGQWLLDSVHDRELLERGTAALAAHHRAHRLEAGMPREALRTALGLDSRLFAELVEGWITQGSIQADGAALRLPGHGEDLSPDDRAAADAALATLRRGGSSPPGTKEAGLPPDLLKALERRGDLVRITPEIAYPADVMRGIERTVVELITREGPASVAEVRDAIGTSRKYAVPLLEYLDSSGLTTRRGDVRVLGSRGRKLAGEPKESEAGLGS